jgi:hypothetical protein
MTWREIKGEDRMAHSHDRTLLASLGFADPDRNSDKHGLACRYLTLMDVHAKVWRRLHPEWFAEKPDLEPKRITTDSEHYGGHGLVEEHDLPRNIELFSRLGKAQTEVHIQKGYSQYATTIGFWDVVLNVQTQSLQWESKSHSVPLDKTKPFGPRRYTYTLTPNWLQHSYGRHAHVEVKANKVDVGSILRQMALYMSYSQGDHYVVAVTWPMTESELGVLQAKGIHVIFLGASFDNYCATELAVQPTMRDDV